MVNTKNLEALFKVINDFHVLEDLEYKYRDDEDIVYEAIYQDGYALKWASERLRDDKDLVITAISSNYLGKSELQSKVLQFASKRLRDDEEVIIESLKHNLGNGYKYASNRIKEKEDIALIAILMSSESFNYISEKLRSNKEFVLKAIKLNNLIYQYLSEEFKTDKDILIEGFKGNNTELYYSVLPVEVQQLIREDRELLKRIVSIDGKYLPIILDFSFENNSSYIDDRELALIAIKTCPDIYLYLSNTLKSDSEIHEYID